MNTIRQLQPGLRLRTSGPFQHALHLLCLLWLAMLLVLAPWAHAQDVQGVPPLSARVIDRTGTLTAQESVCARAKACRV